MAGAHTKHHDYHLVDPSPWPLVGATSATVLAIGAVCGAAGVSLIMTAFIGLPVVADMLILLGGGAAVIAIALVVIWLAIWLFIRMVIGWVRLLVRLGKRWCRKEIAA